MAGRFNAVGGDVVHAAGRVMDLRDAADLVGAWGREAIKADAFGQRRLARLFARDALSLHQALTAALAWRRAAGIPSPIAGEAA